MRLRTFPVFLAFLAMGFAEAVGPFVSLAKNEFQLSNAVASLIPFVGFVMFGLLSIPMGVYQRRNVKKLVLMLGAGAAILQVSGNPIMRDVSDPGEIRAQPFAGAVREGHWVVVGPHDSG